MIEIQVQAPSSCYPVLVGRGVRHRVAELLPARCSKVAVVSQKQLPWGVDPGRPAESFLVGEGELAKSLSSVEELCRGFARFGLSRADAVVAVGGGLVTDLAGFAASIYHRGIAVLHVPTTLLAQVDAAIGGKCGVNLPEGKNLVGSFWQPIAVCCDTETLETLPAREWSSGRGEMAKYAFLGVDGLEKLPLEEQVAACVRFKAQVVAKDERETTGSRQILNYGHTMGHAIEAACYKRGIDIRHGEAVAVGILFAARLAERMGRIDRFRVGYHEEVISALGLPSRIPAGIEDRELLTFVQRDKKATGSITFVLDGPAGPEVVSGIDLDLVAEVLCSFPHEGRVPA